MKSIFLRTNLILISVFLVCSDLLAEGNPRELHEYFREFEKNKYTFNTSLQKIVGDYYVSEKGASSDSVQVPIIQSATKNDVLALYKLECEDVPCQISGYFNLNYYIGGTGKKVSPRFALESYSTILSKNPQLLPEIYKRFLDPKIYVVGYAKWYDSADSFFVVDNPEKFVPKSIRIDTKMFSKKEKIKLIKDCFKKCKKVRVVGNMFYGFNGIINICAETVSKVE